MILYVCKYSKTMASARYRGYGWMERLRSKGYTINIMYSQRDTSIKNTLINKVFFLIKLLFVALKNEIIIFQKYIPPKIVYYFLSKKKIIVDFDDRIYNDLELSD